MRPAVRAPLGAAMHGVLVKGFLLFRRELRVEILDGLVAGGHASLMLGRVCYKFDSNKSFK